MGLADANAVVRESYKFWRDQGLTHEQTCACLGSEEGETSFVSSAVGDHGLAFNVGQWHWEPRGRRIFEAIGIDVRKGVHMDGLKAMAWEMQHADPKTWAMLKAAKTIEDAVTVLVQRFENSKMQARDILRRTNYGKKWAGVFLEDSLPPAPGGKP